MAVSDLTQRMLGSTDASTSLGSKATSSAMFLSVTKILSTCVLFCNAVQDFVDRFLWGRNEMDK